LVKWLLNYYRSGNAYKRAKCTDLCNVIAVTALLDTRQYNVCGFGLTTIGFFITHATRTVLGDSGLNVTTGFLIPNAIVNAIYRKRDSILAFSSHCSSLPTLPRFD
jgi:hypothetical protein